MSSSLTVRFILNKDIPHLLELEDRFELPRWDILDFRRRLRELSCTGLVAIEDGRHVGFVIYETRGPSLVLLNMGVSPDCRRQRIGTSLVERLKSILPRQKRHTLRVLIPESQLITQLFLAQNGFRVEKIHHQGDQTQDLYQMGFSLKSLIDPCNRCERPALLCECLTGRLHPLVKEV